MSAPLPCPSCGGLQYPVGETGPEALSKALLHMSASIDHADRAHRALPQGSGHHASPVRRLRDDVQFHLSQAGRSLANSYDAMRTLQAVMQREAGR